MCGKVLSLLEFGILDAHMKAPCFVWSYFHFLLCLFMCVFVHWWIEARGNYHKSGLSFHYVGLRDYT